MTFETLPGEVRRSGGAEMGQKTEVIDVRRIKRDGKDVYRIDFDDGSRGRTLFVDESGKMLAGDKQHRGRASEGRLQRPARAGEERFDEGE